MALWVLCVGQGGMGLGGACFFEKAPEGIGNNWVATKTTATLSHFFSGILDIKERALRQKLLPLNT